MVYRVVATIFLVIASALMTSVVGAVEPKNMGLGISPMRQEKTLQANKSESGTITVSNLTDKPMKVNLSIKQFSVKDYSYEYQFKTPLHNWVAFRNGESLELKPGQKSKVSYDVVVPGDVATGGYYYALLASTPMTNTGVRATVQVASLLYLKVNGSDARPSGAIYNDKVPFVVFGDKIPYKFDVRNTGNVHFKGDFYAQMGGVPGKNPTIVTAHVILPSTTRSIKGDVPAPFLPGVYQITYGFKADYAENPITKKISIVYIPPWSIVALLLLAGGAWFILIKSGRLPYK